VGFEVPAPTVKLIFEDLEFEGLEIRVHAATMQDFLAVTRWTTGAWVPGENIDHAARLNIMTGEWETICDRFADVLIEWNLERDGDPVPATREGLRSQVPDFVRAIIGAWTDSVTGVSRPLEKPSSIGDSALEASIPMETLSGSLAS
jgi:hypothetical protein